MRVREFGCPVRAGVDQLDDELRLAVPILSFDTDLGREPVDAKVGEPLLEFGSRPTDLESINGHIERHVDLNGLQADPWSSGLAVRRVGLLLPCPRGRGHFDSPRSRRRGTESDTYRARVQPLSPLADGVVLHVFFAGETSEPERFGWSNLEAVEVVASRCAEDSPVEPRDELLARIVERVHGHSGAPLLQNGSLLNPPLAPDLLRRGP